MLGRYNSSFLVHRVFWLGRPSGFIMVNTCTTTKTTYSSTSSLHQAKATSILVTCKLITKPKITGSTLTPRSHTRTPWSNTNWSYTIIYNLPWLVKAHTLFKTTSEFTIFSYKDHNFNLFTSKNTQSGFTTQMLISKH